MYQTQQPHASARMAVGRALGLEIRQNSWSRDLPMSTRPAAMRDLAIPSRADPRFRGSVTAGRPPARGSQVARVVNSAGVKGSIFVAAAMLLALTGCGSTFACEEDSQCSNDGNAGVCQPSTGFCSFPDPDCTSGQKYGALAPMGLANTCVPASGGETESTDDPATATVGTGTTGVATTLPPPSGSGVTSLTTSTVTSETTPPATEVTTEDSSSSSSSSSSDESSTGEPGPCCEAKCAGLCGVGSCGDQIVGESIGSAEAIGVAVIGEDVVWSTGFGRTLQIANFAERRDEQLAAVPDGFITRIAADDTHVYFLDYGSGRVRRAALSNGAIDSLGEVSEGEARFGAIALNDTHVYFAMRGSGNVWRFSKDANNETPELVALLDNPFGVALDEAFVYFVDTLNDEVRRIAFEDIPTDTQGTMVVQAPGVGDIDVDDEQLYFGAGGQVRAADKLGSNEGVLTYAQNVGTVWDLDHDSTHIYFTGVGSAIVGRAAIADPGDYETMAETDQPWGIAVGCREVFWAQNGTQDLVMVGK